MFPSLVLETNPYTYTVSVPVVDRVIVGTKLIVGGLYPAILVGSRVVELEDNDEY